MLSSVLLGTVPIIFFYCYSCSEVWINKGSINHFLIQLGDFIQQRSSLKIQSVLSALCFDSYQLCQTIDNKGKFNVLKNKE
jgi:hypothetical protein